ncbi:MAG: alpha/beta fold hydrolase [Hyphomicrobium sp.]
MKRCIRRATALLSLLIVLAPTLVGAEGRLPAYRTEVAGKTGQPVVLYAEDQGEGPPVVLLHGLGASTFTWRHIAPDLARTHRVIALDLKGFGRSDKPLDDAYGAVDQAHLVAAFVRKRGLDGVTLVGHSFGGAVALRTAMLLREDPGRMASLVLIDAPALPGSLPRSYDFVLVPGVPEALLLPLPPRLIARQLLEASRGSRRGITEEDIEGYAAPYSEFSAKRAFLATARALVGDTDISVEAAARTLALPTLLVWCRSDDIVPLAAGRRLARMLPNATLKTLRGCNHLPQDQRPGALMAILRPFIDR